MLTVLSARHRKQFHVQPIHTHPGNIYIKKNTDKQLYDNL